MIDLLRPTKMATQRLVLEPLDFEIGYGLAAEHRGRGYGNEVVGALSG